MTKNEALKMAIYSFEKLMIFDDLRAEINACKEALESQECKHGVNDGYCKECYMEQTSQEQEPFSYFKVEPLEGWVQCHEDDEGAMALYEHPAPSQEQEPVASQMSEPNKMVMLQPNGIVYENNGNSWNCIGRLIKDVDALCEEYYNRGKRCAHPAQPLSDEEIAETRTQWEAWHNYKHNKEQRDVLKSFARAIEKAHGIGK